MFRSNNNIIGFLQKKSFFEANSKSLSSVHRRYERKQESKPQNKAAVTPPKSSQSKRFDATHNSPLKNTTIQEVEKKVSFDLNKVKSNKTTQNIYTRKIFQRQKESSFSRGNLGMQEFLNQTGNSNPRNILDQGKQLSQTKSRFKSDNNYSKGETSPLREQYFQSSKIEVKMCLQDLYNRVGVELRLVQKAITQMTASLQTMFYSKLDQIRKQINHTIEEMFAEVKSNLEAVVNQSKESNLKDILRVKHRLKEADGQLKGMKFEMDKNWRQVAGEVLSSNLDRRIEDIIKEGNHLRDRVSRMGNANIKKSHFMAQEKTSKRQEHDNFLMFRQSLRKLIQTGI